MNREEILRTAIGTVTGDRVNAYDEPENNFGTIAALWEAYLRSRTGEDVSLRAEDVASMMVLLKVARISSGHAKADNWVDIAGYAACGGEIETKEDEPELPEDGVIASLGGFRIEYRDGKTQIVCEPEEENDGK